uniref:C2H2-type domain-containing protein n=1 Tax=Callorhinchus milii TaxID=7868 RepID=A0A4W3JAM5_CALMI
MMPAASPVLQLGNGVVVPGPGADIRYRAGVNGDGIKWGNEVHTAQMIFLQTELHPLVPHQVLQQPSLQSTSTSPHREDVTCFISVAATSPSLQNQPQRPRDHTPLPGPEAAGHIGQGERPIKAKKLSQCVCPQCGRDCAKPSVLQKHVRSHTGERPFPCSTCGVSFKTQSNLYKHKRTRTHLPRSCPLVLRVWKAANPGAGIWFSKGNRRLASLSSGLGNGQARAPACRPLAALTLAILTAQSS